MVTALMNWLLSRRPPSQVPGLPEWIQDPRGAAPVEIGRVIGAKLAIVLALMGWVAPVASDAANPLDHPVASAVGALIGLAAWLIIRMRLAYSVRLSPRGLEVRGTTRQVSMPWTGFDRTRTPLLLNGLLLSLPLKEEAERVVSGGAVVNKRDFMLFLLQRVQPDGLAEAIRSGIATFGASSQT
jgi:hypothetical protein